MRVPKPDAGEVLVQVLATGMNKTEFNIRLGWYSASVKGSTADISAERQDNAEQKLDDGWNSATPFLLIQGTDCCRRVVAAGDEAGTAKLGQCVIIRAFLRPHTVVSLDNIWKA